MADKLSARSYRSEARAQAASETRERIVLAATELLRKAGVGGFSLEAVAQAAGVSRLTVYNQLGSRRALLEAVFDELASRGGLQRIQRAMAERDPHVALKRLIGIFCEFWSFNQGLMDTLHGVAQADAEFAESVAARNERRRTAMAELARRMLKRGEIRARAVTDLVDMLFALTGMPMYTQLLIGKRSDAAVRKLIEAAAEDAVRRAG